MNLKTLMGRLLVLVALLTVIQSSPAATWIVGAGGAWDQNSNWDPATYPNVSGASAEFVGALGGQTITLPAAPITVGSISTGLLTGASFSALTLGATGRTIVFDSGGPSAAAISMISGTNISLVISATSQLNSNLNVNLANSAGQLTLNRITGTGNITKDGVGLLQISNVSAYSGNITASNGAVLNATGGSMGSGTLALSGNSNAATLFLAFTSSATVNNAISFTSSANTRGIASYLSGQTITLTSNSITGGGSGTLGIGGGGATFTGSSTVVFQGNGFTFNSKVDIKSGGIMRFSNTTGTQTWSEAIGGAGKVERLSGAGTTIFSGSNSYTGSTMVSAGTLIVNGQTSGQGNYIVNGGVLGGGGRIGLSAASSVQLTSGVLSPGDVSSTGTLVIDGGGTAASAGLRLDGGDIVFSLGSSQDLIRLTGFASGFGGGSSSAGVGGVTFTFLNSGGLVSGTAYDLIEFASTPGIALDRFALSTASISNGWQGTFGYDGNVLQFTVIPEPSTVFLTALGLAGILWKRRRA